MSHIEISRKKLLSRVRRIKGQAAALETAIESSSECMAVLQQVAAIKGAVNGLMREVLEDHLREHLGAEKISSEQRQDELEQVILVLRSYLK